MRRPHGAVAEELRGVDVVVVGFPPVVDEDLLVLAAPAVHLVVAGPHGVEDVLGASLGADESVHRELGHVLLALPPDPLHDLQRPSQAVRRDVGRQIRQLPFLGEADVVQRAEDGQRERGVRQRILAAAHDVHAVADPVGIARGKPADQRRRSRRAGVGLQDVTAQPALQCEQSIKVLQAWHSRHSACMACVWPRRAGAPARCDPPRSRPPGWGPRTRRRHPAAFFSAAAARRRALGALRSAAKTSHAAPAGAAPSSRSRAWSSSPPCRALASSGNRSRPPLPTPHGGLASGTAPPAGAWCSSMAPCHSLHSPKSGTESGRSDKRKSWSAATAGAPSRTRLPVQQLPATVDEEGRLAPLAGLADLLGPPSHLAASEGPIASRSWGTGGRTTWHTCR